MIEKLNEIEKRYDEISTQLYQPEVAAQPDLVRKLAKEQKSLKPLIETLRTYKQAAKELADSKAMLYELDDAEMVDLTKQDIIRLEKLLPDLENQLKLLLIPKDPNDDKNIIIEIRAGAGGDEAGLFTGELFRMYVRYAESRGYKVEILSMNESAPGMYKEVMILVAGDGAYSRLKYEGGVHRVQRVPDTEASGRIHTSTVTVAVMPEVEEVDVQINPNELRIDVYRAGGHGGQSVNTTDSAVRITHLPTGIVVAMQDEKSQLKNKEKGMRILRSRIYEHKQAEQNAKLSAERRAQVGTGDRSEKIRTYNFPQSRITDHRIGLSLFSIDTVMEGDVDQLIEPLIAHYQAEALKQGT